MLYLVLSYPEIHQAPFLLQQPEDLCPLQQNLIQAAVWILMVGSSGHEADLQQH